MVKELIDIQSLHVLLQQLWRRQHSCRNCMGIETCAAFTHIRVCALCSTLYPAWRTLYHFTFLMLQIVYVYKWCKSLLLTRHGWYFRVCGFKQTEIRIHWFRNHRRRLPDCCIEGIFLGHHILNSGCLQEVSLKLTAVCAEYMCAAKLGSMPPGFCGEWEQFVTEQLHYGQQQPLLARFWDCMTILVPNIRSRHHDSLSSLKQCTRVIVVADDDKNCVTSVVWARDRAVPLVR